MEGERLRRPPLIRYLSYIQHAHKNYTKNAKSIYIYKHVKHIFFPSGKLMCQNMSIAARRSTMLRLPQHTVDRTVLCRSAVKQYQAHCVSATI